MDRKGGIECFGVEDLGRQGLPAGQCERRRGEQKQTTSLMYCNACEGSGRGANGGKDGAYWEEKYCLDFHL